MIFLSKQGEVHLKYRADCFFIQDGLKAELRPSLKKGLFSWGRGVGFWAGMFVR